MLAEMRTLEALAGEDRPDGAQLLTVLESLHAKLIALRDSATDFMRDLGQVMGWEEAISEEAFAAYKSKVIDHLRGFKAEQTRTEPQFQAAIAAVHAAGIDRLCQLAASAEPPPRYGMSAAQVAAVRADALVDRARGSRVVGSHSHAQPMPRRARCRARPPEPDEGSRRGCGRRASSHQVGAWAWRRILRRRPGSSARASRSKRRWETGHLLNRVDKPANCGLLGEPPA
jgi:hypothetical protein